MNSETIYALSTAPGIAAVAVIRASGPDAGRAMSALCGRETLPEPRRAFVAGLRAPETGEHLDRALCLWFAGPHSFTGEDVAEFHVHGGYGVVNGVLTALGTIPGLRLAEPGEFTRRAFENGRMDLGQVEGLSDLVAARTGAQVRLALKGVAGALGRRCLDWRERLVGVLAHVEAAIDFADEDLEPSAVDALEADTRRVIDDVREVLAHSKGLEEVRRGYSVALLGQPNVGKSSLLNRLSGSDAAIVTETAGTTRDVVRVEMDLGGVAVRLSDTAGLRDGAVGAESLGIARARDTGAASDLVLAVHDGQDVGEPDDLRLGDVRVVNVANKSDLANGRAWRDERFVWVSAKTGEGIRSLVDCVKTVLVRRDVGGEDGLVARVRQKRCLVKCVEALENVPWGAEGTELVAEGLKVGIAALDGVTGVLDPDETLDAVFAEFCIGK